MTEAPPKKSDLGVRTLSAFVMLAVAGTALWLGGWWWTAFVAAVALGVLWEWWGLVCAIAESKLGRLVWLVGGLSYIGLAAFILVKLREVWDKSLHGVILVAGAVIATDVGAYFAGRAIGGPKIAPRISPSKTWAGLGGGILGASMVFAGFLVPDYGYGDSPGPLPMGILSFIFGALIAIVAQAGDFFESWMKRKAGVKDSGNLIPGHGGLFDRVDGLLAVCFVIGLFMTITVASTLLGGGPPLPTPA